jgi:hypothetical protein
VAEAFSMACVNSHASDAGLAYTYRRESAAPAARASKAGLGALSPGLGLAALTDSRNSILCDPAYAY